MRPEPSDPKVASVPEAITALVRGGALGVNDISVDGSILSEECDFAGVSSQSQSSTDDSKGCSLVSLSNGFSMVSAAVDGRPQGGAHDA